MHFWTVHSNPYSTSQINSFRFHSPTAPKTKSIRFAISLKQYFHPHVLLLLRAYKEMFFINWKMNRIMGSKLNAAQIYCSTLVATTLQTASRLWSSDKVFMYEHTPLILLLLFLLLLYTDVCCYSPFVVL